MTEGEEWKPEHERPEFRIEIQNEHLLVADAIRKASRNVDGAPGQFWSRMKTELKVEERTHELCLTWQVDMIEHQLTRVQEVDGREVERTVRPLTDQEIVAALAMPTDETTTY